MEKEIIINEKLNSDLLKHGILDSEGNLNPKIDKDDFQNLLTGGELLIERGERAVLLFLQDSQLKIDLLQNSDKIKHKNVSSAEIYHLLKTGSMYKPMADYGKIASVGKDHLFGDNRNEKTFYVILENERGQTMFTGNDLEKKLKNYKIGDKVQINNTGIIKKDIFFDLNGSKENAVKYDNVFNVGDFDQKNKQVKTSLFEHNKRTNVINELDTTSFSIASVNGHYLSERDVDRLKRGKSISFDDGLEIKISAKEMNRFNLAANSKNLLIGSLLIDGGLSFVFLKTIQVLNKLVTESQERQIENRYLAELQKLKAQLQEQSQKFPNDKSIIDNLNIVSKEIQSVNSMDSTVNKNANQSDIKIVVKKEATEDFTGIKEINDAKYHDLSVDDLTQRVKELENDYSKNLMADNDSTCKRIADNIKEIEKIIRYRKSSSYDGMVTSQQAKIASTQIEAKENFSTEIPNEKEAQRVANYNAVPVIDLKFSEDQKRDFAAYFEYGKRGDHSSLTEEQYAKIPDTIDLYKLSKNEKFLLVTEGLDLMAKEGKHFSLNEKGNIIRTTLDQNLNEQKTVITNLFISYDKNKLMEDRTKISTHQQTENVEENRKSGFKR